MRSLTLHKAMSDKAAAALAGTLLDDNSYDHLIQGEDVIVIDTDTGEPLIIYRANVLRQKDIQAAYRNLREAAHTTDNRGMAAGTVTQEGAKLVIGSTSGTRYKALKADGTMSNTNYANQVHSGVVGYFDRNARFPYCRLTAYNLNHPDRFARAMPLIRAVDKVFADNAPERYAAQKAIVQQTTPDFYISGTVFSTITVNMNFQTAVHQDKGDYKPGFGVMTAIRSGSYDGCYLCWPQYRVAVDMQNGGVCLANVHEWHGNTPLKPLDTYERLSLVFYYREKIQYCGTATEELARVKRRKKGQKLYDK